MANDYPAAGSAFTGAIHDVQLATGDDDHGHLIGPEHLTRIAMAKQ